MVKLLWYCVAWIQEFWILILGSQEISPLKLYVLWSQCNISLPCINDVVYAPLQVSLWLKNTVECVQQIYSVFECSKKISLSNVKKQIPRLTDYNYNKHILTSAHVFWETESDLLDLLAKFPNLKYPRNTFWITEYSIWFNWRHFFRCIDKFQEFEQTPSGFSHIARSHMQDVENM